MTEERKPDASSQPLNCDPDASRWAREFMEVWAKNPVMDEGWMLSWFANAIMCGQDTYRWKMESLARSETGATQDQRAAAALATAGDLRDAEASAIKTPLDSDEPAAMPANPSQDVQTAAHPLNIPALTVGPVEFTEKQMDGLISHMNCDLPPLEKIHQDALRNYKGPLPMPAAHPLPTPRRFQPTTVGNMAVDKNGGYVSVDDYDLLEREAAELRIQVNEWIQANGPHGWIDVLRNERSMLAKDVAELRAQLANTNRAYEVLVLDLHNLTEKVIPNIRETAERQLAEARKDHQELIMAVAQKWPNETRHQTALRYINERESGVGQHLACAAKEKSNG